MSLERGGGEWRRTYLVRGVFPVSMMLVLTDIDPVMLNMPTEILEKLQLRLEAELMSGDIDTEVLNVPTQTRSTGHQDTISLPIILRR